MKLTFFASTLTGCSPCRIRTMTSLARWKMSRTMQDTSCCRTSSALWGLQPHWSSFIVELRGLGYTIGTPVQPLKRCIKLSRRFHFFFFFSASDHSPVLRYLLVTSSITMGGIGIWCMHFIGNRAIIMSDGESAAQISYSSGFTAISFFLPIGVLLGAFYFIGVTEKPNRYYVGLAGTLTGIAVCGMHYVGQLGIANYNCSYHVQNVVGAAVIAVFASLVALSVFFRLRAAWTNSWWKRGFCASILAAAVSGMHWTATVGTFYMFKGRQFASRNQLSRTQTVIVCTVLVSRIVADSGSKAHISQVLRLLHIALYIRCHRKSSKETISE